MIAAALALVLVAGPGPGPGPGLDAFLDAAAKETQFSGVMLVARGDTVLSERAYGLADRAWKVPMTVDAVFPLCSITKTFTSVLVQEALAAAGKNKGVETPLAELLPETKGKPAGSRTVRQLLTHTSGFANPDGFTEPGQPVPKDSAEMPWFYTARRFGTAAAGAKEVLAHPVGKAGKFSYNNGDYLVLSLVIERLTGDSYEKAVAGLAKRLSLKGLRGMHSADFVPNLAVGYQDSETPFKGEPPYRLENFSGAGMLGGTARDVLRWARELEDGKTLSRDVVRGVMEADPSTGFVSYGAFAYDSVLGGQKTRVVDREGAIGAYKMSLLMVPSLHVTALFLSNSDRFETDGAYQGKGMPLSVLREVTRVP